MKQWQANKRQQRFRSNPGNLRKQAERQRQRRLNNALTVQSPTISPPPPQSDFSDQAWSRPKTIPKDFCDRPGCYASKLSGDAVFLYFTLVAVSDKNGLSYYSDNSLALMIRTSLLALSKAREELIQLDLIAYQAPLVQVLSLPTDSINRVNNAEPNSSPTADEAIDLQLLIASLAQKTSVNQKQVKP